MATKDFVISSKQKPFEALTSNQDSQYRNLNLNATNGCQTFDNTVYSKSSSFNNQENNDYNNGLINHSQSNRNTNSWQTRNEKPRTFYECEESIKKKWSKDDGDARTNSSTLALHIAAYENAIETNTTKKAFEGFEFPRQQDDEGGDPEVMQFKSSQKVLNPNDASASKSAHSQHKKEKKHHEPLPNALMMYPMKELVFKGPFTDVVTSPLSISNPTEKTIAFKMMVTAPKHYCCRPNIGYVRPGDTVELQVMVEPMKDEKKIEQEKHKFMIQSLYVKDAPGDLKSQASQVDDQDAQKELPPAIDFWAKDHSKKEIMFHKFTVAFHQQTMTKDKLDGILMDLTSRAAAEAAAEMERERRREEAERRERERLLKKKRLTPEERARLEVLLALQALAMAKQKLTGILRIVPAEEVLFPGPFSEYACSTIRLTNPSPKHIYYKVLVTNPKHYIIKPSFGILKPGETAISVVIIEQQDVYSNIEKEYSPVVENLILRDKFMVHAAYADDASTPIPDFWKKREQGSVYAHKLRISLHLLNAEETIKERERREKLKTTGYKNKDLILSGIYGRDSSMNNYFGKDNFTVVPYPGGEGPNPYATGGTGFDGNRPITPVGASGAGVDGNRDGNVSKKPGGGAEQPPVSAYGGGPLGGPGGSVRAMDAPGGGGGAGGNSPGGANNFNNNNNTPGYNPNMIMGPGGARGGSVMLGAAADGRSGYAAPGNAYMYGAGGATGGGAAAGNNYGGSTGGAGGNNAGSGGNYGGANNAGSGGNYGANNAGNSGGAANAGGGPAGSANNKPPASVYGNSPLGGFGGSVRAMDYGGAGGGASSGGAGGNYGGAGANAGGGPAGSANNRPPASAYGAGTPLGGPGGSVRAMDYGGAAGGASSGGAGGYNAGGGGNYGGAAGNAGGGPAGSANNRPPASAYGAGTPLGGPGGSVRAMDYGGGSGGNTGNMGGSGYNAGNVGGQAGSANNRPGGGGAAAGSVMLGAPGGGINSGYAAHGGGFGGNTSPGGGSGGNAAGGSSGGNSGNPNQSGPQLLLGPGEKLKNASMYMKN